MGPSRRHDPVDSSPPASFATTQWSLVLAAIDRTTPEARQALAALCETYWYPLYAFVRSKGYDRDAAQDLVQEFFLRLLEKDDLRAIAPEKGRFRSFLMAACTHFLANQRDRDRALKRGGRPPISLDSAEAERRYSLEPAPLPDARAALPAPLGDDLARHGPRPSATGNGRRRQGVSLRRAQVVAPGR